MGKTSIEWTEYSWNPVTGCSKVSEGCRHCYAERMARRLAGRYGYPEQPHHFDVTLHPEKLDEPLHWRKPRMVFVCSMSDLFHESVPNDFIRDVFNRMWRTPQHTYQVLTKRPKRMLAFLTTVAQAGGFDIYLPLPNVWLGVTAENQAAADERIPVLLQIPAAVRFVSCEPLLGMVDLKRIEYKPGYHRDAFSYFNPHASRLDWLIAGGESGPGARPMHPDWARSLRDQAQTAGVPFFFKQWGGLRKQGWVFDGKLYTDRLLDGVKWNEMPEAE